MIIYRTVNLVNGHYYIGKDQKDNPLYLGSGLLLSKAIKKYGRENFRKDILERCSNPDTLSERERYWIAKFDAVKDPFSYNIHHGGYGGNTGAYHKVGRSGSANSMYGKKHTPESKNKQRESLANWRNSQEGVAHRSKQKERMTGPNNWNFGKPMPASAKEKLRNSSYNKRGKGYGMIATYKVTDPTGTSYEFETKKMLKEWCISNGHSLWTIERRLLSGMDPKSGSLIGWKAVVVKRTLKLPSSTLDY